jgi:hypothetical protein
MVFKLIALREDIDGPEDEDFPLYREDMVAAITKILAYDPTHGVG